MASRYLTTSVLAAGLFALAPTGAAAQTQFEKAQNRISALRFGSYATSHQVEQLAADEGLRTRAWEAIRRTGITKLYLEVYRGGHTVSPEHLVFVRDWLQEKGLDVVGGIATVPGGDVGVRQQGPLGWFNWQNAKTQRDLARIMRTTAPIFSTFIIDDFLCTGDVSDESNEARGNRSWGEYRRSLLTQLARSIFIEPARQANPGITMIVKYPQWYDRFHLFGYDTETLPRLFDGVWVGTETRGRNTQRFGFVQPYEGFVNYRWLAGIAGDKIGGAWFDHGDCAEHDFLDQAYMSVLAGARELVFFNFGDIMQGHPDHAGMVEQFDRLADLADFVRMHPVVGVPACKPPNSDPAGDMYLMDFLGMLGIPLVPVHRFPDSAPVIFLPAQAAADPALLDRVKAALDRGAHVIVTTSLLLALPQGGELARLLGVDSNLVSRPTSATLVSHSPDGQNAEPIVIEAPIEATAGPSDIVCKADGRTMLFLRRRNPARGSLSLLNTHTYSQADFDAVGEVLLCPRPLGLLSLQGQPLDALRAVFRGQSPADPTTPTPTAEQRAILTAPPCVTLHPFSESGDAGFVVQNFNDKDMAVTVALPPGTGPTVRFLDRFSSGWQRQAESSQLADGPSLPQDHRPMRAVRLTIPARGRVWVQTEVAR